MGFSCEIEGLALFTRSMELLLLRMHHSMELLFGRKTGTFSDIAVFTSSAQESPVGMGGYV